jgi:hypothetical protein
MSQFEILRPAPDRWGAATMIFALTLRVVVQEEEPGHQGNAGHTHYGNLLGHGQRPPLRDLPLKPEGDTIKSSQFIDA